MNDLKKYLSVSAEVQEALAAETVQVIGTKFVLFRRNIKEPKIQLINNKKKK